MASKLAAKRRGNITRWGAEVPLIWFGVFDGVGELEFVARFDAAVGSLTGIEFDSVLGGAVTWDGIKLVRVHVMDRDHRSAGIEIDNVQRDARVFHPEIAWLGVGEDEDHAMVIRHGIALHEAVLALCVTSGNF
jgi:hypothetical protein